MPRGKSRRSLELIEACIEILEEIQPATVRAVCYRLFTRGLISSMSRNETNKVSRQLTDAREAGDIDWNAIVDETRDVEVIPTWKDPEAFGRAMAGYRRNKWNGQPKQIEVWSEKGTVRGVLAPVLNQYEIPFRVMHGYASATAVNQIVDDTTDQRTVALYVGDWDPSGLHMSEVDLPDRLEQYGALVVDDDPDDDPEEAVEDDPEEGLTIHRVALVETDLAGLPSFQAATKRKDPRYAWFVRHYGHTCYELDALSPNVLRDRVEAAIASHLDHAAWNRYLAAERLERESIESTARTWKAILKPASECEPA